MKNLDYQILLSESDRQLVLVVFTAPWSGGAHLLNGMLERVKKDYDNLRVSQFDIEEHPELATDLGITQVPTTLLIRNHQVMDLFTGAIPRRKIIDRLKPHI